MSGWLSCAMLPLSHALATLISRVWQNVVLVGFSVDCGWAWGRLVCLLGFSFLVDNRNHLRIETLNCRHPVLCSQVHTNCSDALVSLYTDWLQQQRDRLLAEWSWASLAGCRGCCGNAVLEYIMRSAMTVTWFIACSVVALRHSLRVVVFWLEDAICFLLQSGFRCTISDSWTLFLLLLFKIVLMHARLDRNLCESEALLVNCQVKSR